MEKTHTNRPVVIAALKLFGESLLFAVFIGAIIAILGYVNRWDTAIQYSNAFFTAGALVIVAGASSRLAAGQERSYFQGHMESLRDMSPGERADFIVQASSSARLVILGALSGIMLILVSVFVPKLF